MNVRRSKRIQLVVDLAKRKEDAAAKYLGEALAAVASAEQQERQVRRYYENYRQQFSKKNICLRPEELQRSREFLGHLDDAIRAQQQQVKIAHDNVGRARQYWNKCHLTSNAIVDYQARCRRNEQLADDKLEQKMLDDLAQIRHG